MCHAWPILQANQITSMTAHIAKPTASELCMADVTCIVWFFFDSNTVSIFGVIVKCSYVNRSTTRSMAARSGV